MFLFCNEDRKKKERLNSLLQTTRNLIKNNEIKDVRKKSCLFTYKSNVKLSLI